MYGEEEKKLVLQLELMLKTINEIGKELVSEKYLDAVGRLAFLDGIVETMLNNYKELPKEGKDG